MTTFRKSQSRLLSFQEAFIIRSTLLENASVPWNKKKSYCWYILYIHKKFTFQNIPARVKISSDPLAQFLVDVKLFNKIQDLLDGE